MRADGVGEDVGLVFEGNAGRRIMSDNRRSFSLPGFAAIGGATNEDAVAGGAPGPVLAAAQLVKGDVAQQGVAGGIVSHGDIARDAKIFGRCAFGEGPVLTAVGRISNAGIDLPGDN